MRCGAGVILRPWFSLTRRARLWPRDRLWPRPRLRLRLRLCFWPRPRFWLCFRLAPSAQAQVGGGTTSLINCWRNKLPFRLCLSKRAQEEITWHCKHYTSDPGSALAHALAQARPWLWLRLWPYFCFRPRLRLSLMLRLRLWPRLRIRFRRHLRLRPRLRLWLRLALLLK